MPRLLLINIAMLAMLSIAVNVDAQMIIAHRGASADAPENTLAAFQLAWQQGADGIEGDFHLTADGQIVCIHDADTKRTDPDHPNRTVAQSTRAELQAFPTLQQVLATVPKQKMMFVEIKCGPEIVQPLKQILESSPLAAEQVVLLCFDARVIQKVRAEMPQYKANWLTSYKQDNSTGELKPSLDRVLRTLKTCGATGLGSQTADHSSDPDFVAAIKNAGVETHYWTVDDPQVANRLHTLNVDSITTNRPGFLRQQIK